jgi:hypothetical protein
VAPPRIARLTVVFGSLCDGQFPHLPLGINSVKTRAGRVQKLWRSYGALIFALRLRILTLRLLPGSRSASIAIFRREVRVMGMR